jgi:DNA repair exonuclease SbcCD ATPase subunit
VQVKSLIFGDWQLDDRPNPDRRDADGRSKRFAMKLETIRGVMDDGLRAGCKRLVFLGDLSEFENPSSVVLEEAAGLFGYWKANGGETVDAIPGNHDGGRFELTSHSLAALHKFCDAIGQDWFNVYSDVTCVQSSTSNSLYLPYLHKVPEVDIANKLSLAANIYGDAKLPTYLYMHYGIESCVTGPKNTRLPGDYLKSSSLPNIKAGFAGHIHKAQTISFERDGRLVDIWLPGSPNIEDQGERNDTKSYVILDDVTGEIRREVIHQDLHWATFRYPEDFKFSDEELLEADKHGSSLGAYDCGKTTVVKIVGDVDDLSEARKSIKKWSEICTPFSVTSEVKAKSTVAVRDDEVARAGSLRDSAGVMAERLFPGDTAVLERVYEVLKENSVEGGRGQVIPVAVRCEGLLTFDEFEHVFTRGGVELFVGDSGIGKTNVLELPLLAATGKTSKGLDLSGLVKSDGTKGWVEFDFEVAAEMYRIRRDIKYGVKSSQSVALYRMIDGKWENRTSGGNKDVLADIQDLIGFSFLGLKTVAFLFQRDTERFVDSSSATRRQIFAELIGMSTVVKAYEKSNKTRLAYENDLKDSRIRLEVAGKRVLAADVVAAKQVECDKTRDSVASAEKLAEEAKAALAVSQKALNAATDKHTVLVSKYSSFPSYAAEIATTKKEISDTVATWEATKNALLKRRDDTKALQAKNADTLKALPAAEDSSVAERLRDDADARKTVVRVELSEARTRSAVAASDLERLVKESTALSAASLGSIGEEGKCSHCGQLVGKAHLEKQHNELVEAAAARASEVTAARAHCALLKSTEEAINSRFVTESAAVAAAGATVSAIREKEKARQVVVGEEARLSQELLHILESANTNNETARTRKTELEAKVVKLEASEAEVAAARDKVGVEVAAASLLVVKGRESVEGAQTTLQSRLESLGALKTALAALERDLGDHFKAVAEVAAIEASNASTALKAAVETKVCAVLDKGGLQAQLIDAKKDYLEARINYYLGRMAFTGVHVEIVTVEDGVDTLAIRLNRHDGCRPVDIRGYSCGQLDRVELAATKFAFVDLVHDIRGHGGFGGLFLDEPATSFDDISKRGFLELLQEKLVEDFPVCVIISHDEMIQRSVDSKIRLGVGDNGETRKL